MREKTMFDDPVVRRVIVSMCLSQKADKYI